MKVKKVRLAIRHVMFTAIPADSGLGASELGVAPAAPPDLEKETDRILELAKQPRQSEREMVNGESHYFLGRRYRLRVHEQDGAARVALRGVASMDLFVRPGSSAERRQAVLLDWHRASLRSVITDLLAYWQPVLGVQATQWGIKKMKTKWGSCNVSARRIWLNLELAKKPLQCLEYILVHELVHLLERNHTERFTALMDRHLPDWRTRRQVLNSSPLGHKAWSY